MTSRFHFFIVFFLLLISLQSANAGISQHLAYQGVLTDTAGNPRPDGNYVFTFQLYDVETGGAALWSEEKTLYVNKGIFSTFLGNVTPFGPAVMFNKPYWLGITVGSAAELTPRVPLGSAAYCLRAQWADTAEYARGAAGGDLTGNFPNPSIAADSVNSSMILDGTIQRADIAAGFKAPYADSSDFADYANVIASNAVDGSKIADSTITDADISASAAIAGTKVSPDFGTQNIVTRGSLSSTGTENVDNRLRMYRRGDSLEVAVELSTITASDITPPDTTQNWFIGMDDTKTDDYLRIYSYQKVDNPRWVFWITEEGVINIPHMPEYPGNDEAIEGGLVEGDLYRTATGSVRIVY